MQAARHLTLAANSTQQASRSLLTALLTHTDLSLSRSLSRSLSLDLLRGRPPRSYLQRTTQHRQHRDASQLHIPTSCTSSLHLLLTAAIARWPGAAVMLRGCAATHKHGPKASQPSCGASPGTAIPLLAALPAAVAAAVTTAPAKQSTTTVSAADAIGQALRHGHITRSQQCVRQTSSCPLACHSSHLQQLISSCLAIGFITLTCGPRAPCPCPCCDSCAGRPCRGCGSCVCCGSCSCCGCAAPPCLLAAALRPCRPLQQLLQVHHPAPC